MITRGIFHEQCWESVTDLGHIRKCIRNGHNVLIIMRGVPGSGKSHLASELLTGTNGAIFSSDNYFMRDGVFHFDPSKLEEYHQKNFKEGWALFQIDRTKEAMVKGVKPVIIDNTNIYVTHMRPYIMQAVKNSYEIYFVEPETSWKTNAQQCARINPPLFTESDDGDDVAETSMSSVSDKVPSGIWYCPLLEYPKVTEEESAESEELLPTDVASLDISESSAKLDCTTNSDNKQLPLIPVNGFGKRKRRTVGCQTSEIIRLFDLSEVLPAVSGAFTMEMEENETEPTDGMQSPEEKAVQTE
ncbi:unnamed protein product [Gongylonema pulchrum]|uniref:NEDD4-binding protein 2-like 1 n=1 Tax=Gongylonema pulchrum TaxID=637853 RepID=A0A183DVZ8_9BILA|nr:unnamed protein product [Gongylonema pulchrum]